MAKPVVNGISPKEATPGTKLTIRGDNLGSSPQDLIGLTILGADCLMTAEWKSPRKIIALCPAKEGKGEIIITTAMKGVGTCEVAFRAFKETIGPLKEVASWQQEKHYFKRKNRVFSPTGADQDDPLGLSVEGNVKKFPDDQLQEMFTGMSGDIGAENFDPGYFLLENHHATTFEDLKAGLGFLKRKVDGENESQLSFIKANVNSIMDQLDTLNSIKKRHAIDNKQYGKDPTIKVEEAIDAVRDEAHKMFFDVLGRKDTADATRNSLTVMNRFKFLFNLPASIEGNIAKNDFDRVIDEYERAKSLYGNSNNEVFQLYLDEIENGVNILRDQLRDKLTVPNMPVEQQKKLIGNLIQLDPASDPAWDCLQVQYGHLVKMMEACRDIHIAQEQTAPAVVKPSIFASPSAPKISTIFNSPQDTQESLPQSVMFIEDVTERLAVYFPDLWKLGQAYFKGDLVVSPDPAKQAVFKEMILGAMRYFCNLVRNAVIPQTMKAEDAKDYGQWQLDSSKSSGQWLPHCLRHVRNSYSVFIELDLPGQVLEIIKDLTTDLRIQTIQIIFQTVIDQVHLLHEKEDWRQDITDEHGSVTGLPGMFEELVSESVQLIKEAVLSVDKREEDILSYKNAHSDLELLIKDVLSSFASTLENAAVEDYHTGASNVPTDSVRLLLCMNNCQYTQMVVLPKIQKAFQDVGSLSLEKPIAEACKCYHILDGKLFEAYMELKCEPIVAIIEPSMYVGRFDWARCSKPIDARDYVKEIIHNVISVHSEVERVSATSRDRHSYIESVMLRLVEAIAEEINRLFCCIHRMNNNGCIQAFIDINCLQKALQPFLNRQAANFFAEASKPLMDLEKPGDSGVIKACEAEFQKRMRLHLSAFEIKVAV